MNGRFAAISKDFINDERFVDIIYYCYFLMDFVLSLDSVMSFGFSCISMSFKMDWERDQLEV